MTKEQGRVLARRAMLRRAAFLSGASVIPALSVDNPEVVEQKVPRELMHYAPRAADGDSCAGCALFMPGEHPRAAGVCRLVAGLIAPTACCDAHAARHELQRPDPALGLPS